MIYKEGGDRGEEGWRREREDVRGGREGDEGCMEEK